MIDDHTLLSDQVFQLNVFLWALEDLPDEGDVHPALRRAGYDLEAIGRPVIMPVDGPMATALGKLTEKASRTPCRPDLWLKHKQDTVRPLIELKSHGFSEDSSNRKQALKLIAGAADLAPSLAQPETQLGHVLYATVVGDAEHTADTLKALAQKLRDEGGRPAPTGVIGLAIERDGVVVSTPDSGDLPKPLGRVVADRPTVLHRVGENDLQPLYFIPWIPGIEDSQDSELHSAGLQELTARVLSHVLARCGQAIPPTTLTLEGKALLHSATFGVFSKWRDEDRQLFSESVARIVDKTLKSVVKVDQVSRDIRKIELHDDKTKEAVIERLELANPADPSTNLKEFSEQQPTLFDNP